MTTQLEHGEGMHLWSNCSLCCVKQITQPLLTTTPQTPTLINYLFHEIHLLQGRIFPAILFFSVHNISEIVA